ncbi:MAG: hypothetical protein A3D31_11350 [Candidatus Fluviicola riflensis]|nr:MAG: hypothetical protein CHH17_15775 [Candidatus Fluviicola riflensis]OGS77585.1 MAG: hypothetical protein A3D31_11350 [Candidatus Fluviicola riflensis]OGS84167.1 MAG: hypothetical protein A3E30_12755 [Fluviicola sp. RIFCSPHIGHO2_12_FULL_43_24]OGS84651.1 MAG: hypothetical protein A2724_08285 [Fluviicola sp. RIFCSPHIGHO2_01_FULL_43_53]
MEVSKMSFGKQLLIQVGINILASAIVSYIMYKLLQPKPDPTTPPPAAKTVGSTPTVTATTVPTTTGEGQ